jgi:hypothetical protein
MIKIFYPNSVGKIELTKEDLEKLLKEAYNEGYDRGRNYHSYVYTPYYTALAGSCSNALDICYDNTISNKIASTICDVATLEAKANVKGEEISVSI